jgi:zinc protease
MRSRFSIPGAQWLFAAALGLVFGMTAARADAPRKVTSVEGITEYRLDNGLRVLLFPDPSRPKVTVNLTVLVGSRHEGYGETGMAHLLEHMVFKGTPTHPDIPGIMKERGADFNGSTDVDRTNYYESLPAGDENLEFAIKLEADRMVNSPIKAEDLATEFSVVRNEFESGENSPEEILSQRMMAVAYEWHNYGKSVIGNRSDIEKVPADSLRAFYKKYYQPDNAVLVVAGKFDEKNALEFISKYFGSLAKPDRKLTLTYTEEPAQDGERFVTLRRVGNVGLVGLIFHIPSGSHAEFPAVAVLADILDSEPSGRLYKALVETKKASNVMAYPHAYHDPGALEIMAEVNTKDRAALEKVRDTILSVLEEVARSGVTQEEVDRARQAHRKAFELAAQDPNRIAVGLSEWAAQGDWRLRFLNRDRVEKVTPAEVKDVAQKYLTASNRTVGFFIPTSKPERTPIPDAPDIAKLLDGYTGRKVEASQSESFDVSPMAIEARIQRPEPIGGIKLALLPKKTRGGIVQLQLTLRYGNAENLKGFQEAAAFLPELMTQGTAKMTRQQIKDALDKNFGQLSTGSGGRMMRGFGGLGVGAATFAIRTKRPNLPAVLEILRQVLREPTLPAHEFEIMKNEQISATEEGRTDPLRLGFNRFQRLMARYSVDDVRYVPTLEEQLERTRKLSIDQVRTLYREYLGAEHGELVVVGDFEPSEVLPILGKMLDGWKAGKPYARIDRPMQHDLKAEKASIETPDKANAVYLAGLKTPIKDSDPDYPDMVAGNYILGGGALSSRIADRLRQKGGLSYTAMSMFSADAFEPHAALMILAIYNPTNVEKVVSGVDEEVQRFLRDGVKPDELDKAKAGYLQQLRNARADDRVLVGSIAEDLYIGRTMEFQAEFEKKLSELKPEAVNAAIRKHIDPKRLSVVTVGDFKKK